MMSIVEFLSQPLCVRLGMTLVHFLWQGLAVALLIGLFVRVFGIKHGNGRYGAYLFAFIVMVGFVVVTFTVLDVPMGLDTEVAAESAPVEMVENSYRELPAVETAYETEAVKTNVSSPAAVTVSVSLGERLSGWLDVSIPWFIAVWMVGVLVLSVRLIMGFVGVYRWRSHLEPLPQRLDLRVALLSEGLGMGGFCRVFVSPSVLQAMAVGYFRPMVLLPAAMVTQMQPEMLEAVIAHELAHIRRFDLWVNLLQRVVETLLFYHPAVWWLSNHIRSERELCCDELAVKATGERLTYATTLESVSRGGFSKQPVLATGLGQDRKPTLYRVRHVLGLTPAQRNCPFWLAGVIAVGLLAAITIPTTLALTKSEEKPVDLKSEVIEGIVANRNKFECGYLAWSSKRINNRFADSDPRSKDLAGEHELWWDGKKMTTQYVQDQVYQDPEGNFRVEKKQGSDSYDGGVLTRKPRFRDNDWLGPQITRWRGSGSQDEMVQSINKLKNSSIDWSVVENNGVKLIRLTTRVTNQTNQGYGAYSIRDYDTSKGYGLVNKESYNPDGTQRSKHTVKLKEVIGGGWFPVEVDFKHFAITDGHLFVHSHFALDIERCSFNDKAVFPDRIFKGAIDKQIKYQEKVQMYLAMELEGLSRVKEAGKEDTVKLGARVAIEEFVRAAMARDVERAGEFARPDRMDADAIREIPEELKGQDVWIMAVVADEKSAIAVSSVVQVEDGTGPLVFLLDRAPQDGRDNWWVYDIDLETPDSAEVDLKRFLEEHPEAQRVLLKNKPAVQIEVEKSSVETDVEAAVLLVSQQGESPGHDTIVRRRTKAYRLIKKHPEAKTLPCLVKYFDSSDDMTRWAARHIVSCVKWDDAAIAIKPLRRLLLDTDEEEVAEAIVTLGALQDKGSLDAIIEIADDANKSEFTRQSAVWALGELRDKGAIAVLKRMSVSESGPPKKLAEGGVLKYEFLEKYKHVTGDERKIVDAVWMFAHRNGWPIIKERALDIIQNVAPEVSARMLEDIKTYSFDIGWVPNSINDSVMHLDFGLKRRQSAVQVEGDKEALIENIIEAVRQAQRPCENMRVEWTWEPSGGGARTVTSKMPTAPAKRGGWKYDYTAIFAGIRSRIETRAEFWPEEADKPSSAFTEVGVFDGIKYKSLKRYSMGEAAKRRPQATIQAKDANLGLWQRRLFADAETVNFEQLRLLGKYKDMVLTESEGEVYFLDFVRKSGMKRRATIELKKGYNVTKIESMRADGTPYFEIEYQVKRYEGGQWFTGGYEFVRYPRKPGSAAASVPRVEQKAVVKKVEFDVDVRDEMFALEIPNGAEVHDLILNILYFTGPGEDKILEMPGDLPDYSNLKAVIEIAYAARDKLLSSSKGKAKLTLEKISRSAQATVRLQDGLRNELRINPKKAALLGQYSWAVDWYNKGLKKRYDVFVAKPEESAEGMRPLLLLENKRIATDPEKGLHYNVKTKEAYITKRPVRANNPTNLGNYFRIQRLYRCRLGTLPEILTLYEEHGNKPTVSREKVDGQYCIKIEYTSQGDLSSGEKYITSVGFWVVPQRAYALVKAEFCSGRGTGGGELPLREGYYASYEESDKFQGIWLLKDVTMVDNQGPATEKLTASLSGTEIGVDIPDSTFTFEGLGVPAGTRVYDR